MARFLIIYGNKIQKEKIINASSLKEAEAKANLKYKTWVDIYKMKGTK